MAYAIDITGCKDRISSIVDSGGDCDLTFAVIGGDVGVLPTAFVLAPADTKLRWKRRVLSEDI